MTQIITRKRRNKWEYSFEISQANGKRKYQSQSGFATKEQAFEAAEKALSSTMQV